MGRAEQTRETREGGVNSSDFILITKRHGKVLSSFSEKVAVWCLIMRWSK
jgi:hypothetical protein